MSFTDLDLQPVVLAPSPDFKELLAAAEEEVSQLPEVARLDAYLLTLPSHLVFTAESASEVTAVSYQIPESDLFLHTTHSRLRRRTAGLRVASLAFGITSLAVGGSFAHNFAEAQPYLAPGSLAPATAEAQECVSGQTKVLEYTGRRDSSDSRIYETKVHTLTDVEQRSCLDSSAQDLFAVADTIDQEKKGTIREVIQELENVSAILADNATANDIDHAEIYTTKETMEEVLATSEKASDEQSSNKDLALLFSSIAAAGVSGVLGSRASYRGIQRSIFGQLKRIAPHQRLKYLSEANYAVDNNRRVDVSLVSTDLQLETFKINAPNVFQEWLQKITSPDSYKLMRDVRKMLRSGSSKEDFKKFYDFR